MLGRGRRSRDLPGALPERLRDRRPVPPGRAARHGGGRDRRGRRGLRGPGVRARGRGPDPARQPGAQRRRGDPPRPDPRRRTEVVPSDVPRVLRAPLVRARRRRPGYDGARRPGGPDRAGPVVRGGRRPRPGAARRGLRGHVGAGAAECRGRPRGRDGAGEPLRQPDHRRPSGGAPLLVRSASSRCLAAYVYAAAGQGESSTDLSWDGQTMVYEMRRPARRDRAVP